MYVYIYIYIYICSIKWFTLYEEFMGKIKVLLIYINSSRQLFSKVFVNDHSFYRNTKVYHAFHPVCGISYINLFFTDHAIERPQISLLIISVSICHHLWNKNDNSYKSVKLNESRLILKRLLIMNNDPLLVISFYIYRNMRILKTFFLILSISFYRKILLSIVNIYARFGDLDIDLSV